jgi:hypothetical protein
MTTFYPRVKASLLQYRVSLNGYQFTDFMIEPKFGIYSELFAAETGGPGLARVVLDCVVVRQPARTRIAVLLPGEKHARL